MKKTLIFFLLLVLIFIPTSFFMAEVYASEEWSGSERAEETNILVTNDFDREVSLESKNEKITLQTKVKFDIELICFCDKMNSDSFKMQLATDNEILLLTYHNEITDEDLVGVLKAEYQDGNAEAVQSTKFNHAFNSKIIRIIIKIEFIEDGFFVGVEAYIRSATGAIEFSKEELRIKAEGVSNDSARLFLNLISGESAPGWNPEVKVTTVLQTVSEQPPNGGIPQKGSDITEPEEQNHSGKDDFIKQGNPTDDLPLYSIIIAAGGGMLLVLTAGLIIRNKRRKV